MLEPPFGCVIGLGAAVLLGVLIYRGAVRINLTKYFRHIGILLIMVAACILAYGVQDLQEAGVLPREGLSGSDIRVRPSAAPHGCRRPVGGAAAHTRRPSVASAVIGCHPMGGFSLGASACAVSPPSCISI